MRNAIRSRAACVGDAAANTHRVALISADDLPMPHGERHDAHPRVERIEGALGLLRTSLLHRAREKEARDPPGTHT